jgi:cell surface protein
MKKDITIHLEKANTLSNFISEDDKYSITSLKITGFIGIKDIDKVLDDMCSAEGQYDEYNDFILDLEASPALRHLDLGESIYIDGEDLPFFGWHTQVETLIFPQGITNLGEIDTGFSDSEMLKHIVLPQGLKIVYGFMYCPNLSEVVLPDSVEEITFYAFSNCKSITSIHIPASVRKLDGGCFAGCSISSFSIDDNNPYFSVVDGVIFSKDLTTLVAFPSKFPHKSYTIPNTTKVIGEDAFADANIETIKLPNSLISIERLAFQHSNIKSIELPESIETIGEYAFHRCISLESVYLSRKITNIPRCLFSSCYQLKELKIPSSVKTIYYSAIAWCENLEKLYLHEGLEEIVDEGPMLGVRGKLKQINLPSTLKKIPGGLFNYSPYLEDFNLSKDNSSFSLIDGALCSKDGKILFSVLDNTRKSYSVSEGIEVIEERVFAFFYNLSEIKLPSTLKEIKHRAFQDCDSLSSIEIPSNVVKIDYDFLWSDKLESITINCAIPPKMVGVDKHPSHKYKDVKLYVPQGCKSIYNEIMGWNHFKIMEK